MKKFNIIYFPANKNYNPYNTRIQEIVRQSGSAPRGLNSIFKPNFILGAFSGRKNIFILNWFEDYPFDTKGRVKPLKLIFFTCILFYAKIFGTIFYIKHNFTKHNLDSKHSKFHTFCQRLVEKNSSEIFVHSERVSEKNNYTYIPHPLYKIMDQPAKAGDKYFLCFGMISRYKGYIELLDYWPKAYPLLITGPCNDLELIAELEQKIKLKQLNATVLAKELSDLELEATIKNCIAVILPHTNNSCIVSGAAYLAYSLGALTLVRDENLLSNLAEPSLTKRLDNQNIKTLYEMSENGTLENDLERRKHYAANKYSDSIIFQGLIDKIHLHTK
ncbi:hypothetical protein [Pseudomonas sp. GL-B-12]|uniref:hypothetical protein n=1 Tax=Pseudomonas sp. GL-B-12 TaxID=2832374 RepID=UPI001CBB4DF3|nr:hypothetical protein [Pseudomonas sp. GL-B-12]